ncbi:SIR2 family protein [Candidatus Methanarcanum hacksteinii]|uniref:SIR2 family protein n=1 Tax=Candidatus Methanarcanum hacksteinii TaxID=2911857 RepID=UPI0037DD0A1D
MDSTLFSEFNRPPALIIGSGISLRYLEGSKDWVGLLKALATRMGMSNGDFLAYESGAKLEFNKNKISDGLTTHLPYLCYDLEKYLIDSFKNKTLNASEFFTEEEYKQYEEGMDSLKILAASEVQNYKLRTDDKCLGEIELFRKIANVIPCVITTNYDDFLEKEIFQGKFAVYSDVSDYYDPESQGIGEIYKIHGTANNPNSMILNVEDYKSFEKKICYCVCEYYVSIMRLSRANYGLFPGRSGYKGNLERHCFCSKSK